MKSLLLIFGVIGVWSVQGYAAFTQRIGDDFYIVRDNSLADFSLRSRNLESCKSAIKAAICLVDPAAKGQKANQRVCLTPNYDYAKPFEQLYDRLPSHLQKMFCHISRIFVEKESAGSAYGSLYENDQGQIVGGMLGIREDLVRNPHTLDEWATWKEQIHFGVDPTHVNNSPNLPLVKTTLNADSIDMLYFLVTHEFAHMLDFTNLINHDSTCKDRPGRHNCDRRSWHAFSWGDDGKPLPANDFPLRSKLCYYFCKGNFIDPALQDELYLSLQKTNFLTPYTTRFSSEDFADTFALYTIMTDRRAGYSIETPNLKYDVIARLLSADLEDKRNFIRSFLESSYDYPGQ